MKGEKKMEKSYLDRLLGQYCKIVSREPGEEKVSVISGTLEDIDYDTGLIMVDSKQGLGCLSINTIVAIKPKQPKHQRVKKKEKLHKNNLGFIGIGTLIVFIAMVLVAAVAASILVQTSENLQSKSLQTGSDTTKEVASGLKVMDVTGYTDADKTHIQYVAFSVAPRAGSDPIDLENLVIYLQHDRLSVLGCNTSLIRASTGSGGVFQTLNLSQLNALDFGIIGLHDADNSINTTHGLGKGDAAFLVVNMSAAIDGDGILPRKTIQGKIIPEEGSPGVFYVSTPTVFRNRVIDLLAP